MVLCIRKVSVSGGFYIAWSHLNDSEYYVSSWCLREEVGRSPFRHEATTTPRVSQVSHISMASRRCKEELIRLADVVGLPHPPRRCTLVGLRHLHSPVSCVPCGLCALLGLLGKLGRSAPGTPVYI